MRKLKVLDLFCGAGGTSMGLHLVGFEVVGVDNQPQPHYPFEFHQGDALEIGYKIGHEFDLVVGGPPCQFGSNLTPSNYKNTGKNYKLTHVNLIPQTRELMLSLGKPYIIENVAGSRKHLVNPVMLCGSMFGLSLFRHRYFEYSFTDFLLSPAGCNHSFKPVLMSGRSSREIDGRRIGESPIADRVRASGIDWMTYDELSQAIPPAYSQWLGLQAIKFLEASRAA